MKNKAIIIKLRSYMLGLTWPELNNLSRQDVINNVVLTEDETTDLNFRFRRYKRYFKQAWKDVQHADLKQNTILPALIIARDTIVSDLAVLGLSSETAIKIFKRVLSDMLGGE